MIQLKEVLRAGIAVAGLQRLSQETLYGHHVDETRSKDSCLHKVY